MSNTKANYKATFKGTSIFGGVQIFSILASVLRTKFIAILLGTSGLGTISIFNSVLLFLTSVTGLGLPTIITRDIAASNSVGVNNRGNLIILIRKSIRLIFFSALLGLILTSTFSPIISKLTFNNFDYLLSFLILSVAIFFSNLSTGYNSIMQGCQQVNLLAKANIFAALISVVVIIPVLFTLKHNVIVIYVVIFPVVSYLTSRFFFRKLKSQLVSDYWRSNISRKSLLAYFKQSIWFGMSLVITNALIYLVGLGVKVYLLKVSSDKIVGLYDAAWVINSAYLGVVFNAMATDYFPRLSGQISSRESAIVVINHQAEMSLLLLGPMIVAMQLFLPLIIQFLYTKEFLAAENLLRFFLLGSILRAGAWAMSFVFLAKKDNKSYLINEFSINILMFIFYISGYHYFGLRGLGYAYCGSYLVYLIIVLLVANKKYKIAYNRDFWKIFTIIFTAILISALSNSINHGVIPIVINSTLLLLIAVYSFRELDKRVGLKQNLLNFKRFKG